MASVTPRRNAWDEPDAENLRSGEAPTREEIIDPELENEFGRLEDSRFLQTSGPGSGAGQQASMVARPNRWRERE